MIKILLTSDLHLGMNGNNLPITDTIRINTFKRIASLAREHDILLISGDLFDNYNINNEIIDIISSEFNKILHRDVKIIYTPGERELGEKGEIPSYLSALNPTHLFDSTDNLSPYIFVKDNQKIYIYGFPASKSPNILKISKASTDGFHIGLFHADFSNREISNYSNVYTLQKKDIKLLDLDFYALGHKHQFKLYKHKNRIIAAYPGSAEATNFNESGDRYVLSFVIENNEIFQIKRLTVNTSRLNETIIDCSTITYPAQIIEILDQDKSPKDTLRILLTGNRNFNIDYDSIYNYGKNFVNLIIDDKSTPDINLLIDEYKDENTLRGEFFSLLKQKIQDKELPSEIDTGILSFLLNQISKYGLSNWENLCK